MSSRRDRRAALVLGLLLAPIGASRAQRVCLRATPTARTAITYYLQDPDERAWLQAHGITATSADQLTPLTDAADRAMCRRMDSTMRTRPIYYLRAGAFVIATAREPVNRRPGVIGSGHDLGNDLFVLDTTGRWVHSPGEPAVAAPPAQRAAADSARRAQHCRNAIPIVARGKPETKDDWAWSTVLGCGAAGGIAARDAWRRTRTETDLRRLEELYGRLWSMRDAALFEAARSIATDPNASAPSRVYSTMMIMGQLFDREDPEYASFTSVGAGHVCAIGIVYDRSIYAGQPLPAHARQRGLQVGQRLANDARNPAIVRSAGRCLVQTIRIDDEIRSRGSITPRKQ